MCELNTDGRPNSGRPAASFSHSVQPPLSALVNALGEVSEVSGLTVVELDILRLAAHRGATAKDISKELSGGRMSVRTVATLWQHIYEKLGVRSQAQAVCAAVQRGLISAEPEALKMNPKEIK